MSSSAIVFQMKGDVTSALQSVGQLKSSLSGLESSLNKLQGKSSLLNFSGMMGGIKSFAGGVMNATKSLATMQSNMLGVMGVQKTFGVAKDATQSFATFEQGLAKVKAVTGSSADEMAFLEKLVYKLGFETKFTSQQILDAAFNLGTLGVKGNKAFGDLLPIAAKFAITTDRGIDRAAEVLLSTIRTFGMGTKDAERVADVLTGAYTSSAMNLDDWAVSSQYAGLAAQAFNAQLEDLVPLIMALRDKGIDASIAGTQIRTTFLELLDVMRGTDEAAKTLKNDLNIQNPDEIDPTKVGFIGALERLQRAGANIKDLNRIFNVRGAPIISGLLTASKEIDGVMYRGVDAIRKYQEAVKQMGITNQHALERQKGYFFSVDVAKAGIESFSIKLGQVIVQAFKLQDTFNALGTNLFNLKNYLDVLGPGRSFEIMFDDKAKFERSFNMIAKSFEPLFGLITTAISFTINTIVIPAFRGTVIPMMKNIFINDILPALGNVAYTLVDKLGEWPKNIIEGFYSVLGEARVLWDQVSNFFDKLFLKAKMFAGELIEKIPLFSSVSGWGKMVKDKAEGDLAKITSRKEEIKALTNIDKEEALFNYDAGKSMLAGWARSVFSASFLGISKDKPEDAKSLASEFAKLPTMIDNIGKAISYAMYGFNTQARIESKIAQRPGRIRSEFGGGLDYGKDLQEQIYKTLERHKATRAPLPYRQYQSQLPEDAAAYVNSVYADRHSGLPFSPVANDNASALRYQLMQSGMPEDEAMKIVKRQYGENVTINIHYSKDTNHNYGASRYNRLNKAQGYSPKGAQENFTNGGFSHQ